MACGLTIENTNFCIEKAKSKKDGVYQIRGCGYRVRNGKITHFQDHTGVYESHGHFLAKIGEGELYGVTNKLKLIGK